MGFRLANIDGRAALVNADHYYDIATASDGRLPSDPMTALNHADELRRLSTVLAEKSPSGDLASATFGAPVPRPQNSFAIGLNYRNHVAEASMDVPENPLVFTKFPSCICGPNSDIELRSDGCDYEGELLVVIGPGGKDIAVEDAWDHVLGLSVAQDFSDRPMQFAAKPPHFDLGKSFDTFGPTGPTLVSPDLLPDPRDLRITTTVNGELRQDDTTASLIFDVATLVSYLSRVTTLVTGDIIFTGTPEGVGAVRGEFLKDGDVVETSIEGLGTMTNRCRRMSDH